MQTYDSTVKLARAVQRDDVLVGVGPRGETLYQVREVTEEDGQIVVVTDEQTVTFAPRDQVRVAHPDVVEVHEARHEADART